MQDIEFCQNKYPNVLIKPIALQFLSEDDVAILEISVGEVNNSFEMSVVEEKHYQLVDRNGISDVEIWSMSEKQI